MLTVHHLGKSQSERIVWLCEELRIPYTLQTYTRRADNMLSPPELRALHPIGSAPVITDGEVLLAESGAIMDYVIARHGGGRLALPPDHADYPHYLYWLHFANGSLQPAMGRRMMIGRLQLPPEHPMRAMMEERLDRQLRLLDARVAAVPWLAGEDFTAADIMMGFPLTTMRYFAPLDLGPYAGILAYLQRIAARPGYQRAMAKGDPGMPLLLT
ncbi:glutathione S-transferase family protein [Paracraurococcus ruber]|uniref:Glutathione S-transferase n=1 Tax=Paracraurococcus ruber TaxID=77675 RepID=A0ABS1D1L7_9PROT|nr:glutathione S-transferase [Paracraurococcus ruber]MBK1660187.1 glutathione S-transferase [Paracraurococcus ruber]TDG28342.1 glutathione S-transferase [Paracraurococcus ruber]